MDYFRSWSGVAPFGLNKFAFFKYFNLLLIDLGVMEAELIQNLLNQNTLLSLAEDIFEVMDYVKVEKSHFVGISLGTILIVNYLRNTTKTC